MSASEMRALVREYRRRGWRVRPTGGGHLRWEHDDVEELVFSSSTPSCCFAIRKVRAQLEALTPQDPRLDPESVNREEAT